MKELYTVIILSSLLCCDFKTKNKSAEFLSKDTTYHYQPLEWEITIPKDYEFLTKDQEEKLTTRGLNAIEKSVGTDVDVQPFNHLINFRKDAKNVFLSSSQVVNNTDFPMYQEIHKDAVSTLIQTYEDNNIPVDHTAGTETIDGKKFIKDKFNLLSKEGKVLMTQIMYTRLFDSMELTVTISWSDQKYGDEMVAIWRKSTFKK